MSQTLIESGENVKLGAALPQIVHAPPDIVSYSHGEDAIALANSYLFDSPACVSPSQELRLRNGMATRSDGKWAASRVADFGGRQGAGKTDTVLARILSGAFLLGHKLIIYTAHEYPTANEIFIRLGEVLGGWDDLAVAVKHERRAHGDQGFELKDSKNHVDCRILIKTRTGKSGRGFAKADLIIYDEAQHLMPEHVAGSGPAKLAHPNPQSWYAGSGGLESSVKAWELRRQALTGTGGRLSYTEHTAQVASVVGDRILLVDPDPDDRVAWYQANPGLGRWVTEEGMADMRDELGELFPREGLCVWAPEPSDERHDRPISLQVWDMLERPTVDYDRGTARLAVAVAHDRSWATIGLAAVNELGFPQLRLVAGRPGTGWVAARAAELAVELGGKVAVLKGEPVIEDMRRAGVDVHEVSQSELATATGRLIDATSTDDGHTPMLRHQGAPELRKALEIAEVRPYGDNAQVWSARNSSGDISPLTAVTMAFGRLGADTPEEFFVY